MANRCRRKRADCSTDDAFCAFLRSMLNQFPVFGLCWRLIMYVTIARIIEVIGTGQLQLPGRKIGKRGALPRSFDANILQTA
jgi:hypothetical protein